MALERVRQLALERVRQLDRLLLRYFSDDESAENVELLRADPTQICRGFAIFRLRKKARTPAPRMVRDRFRQGWFANLPTSQFMFGAMVLARFDSPVQLVWSRSMQTSKQ